MDLVVRNIEQSLVEGCRNNDRKSQEALYRRYSKKMFGVCLRYAKDRSTAEDILQEGFIKVFNGLKKFRGDGSLEGWVRRIMVNTAIENYRKTIRLHVVSDFEENGHEEFEETILQKMHVDEILKLVQNLPDGFRTVFSLYVIDGYTHKEVAKQLGISEGTSKSQLARARNVLKKRVTELYEVKTPIYAKTAIYR
ncbi:MAG: sigma-70 family RNA polymerase sigma factor [Bacteroidetes bacterium]|nr:sigma-70 family RNA polymerase sigma factor [Bacteroidota bacterium]